MKTTGSCYCNAIEYHMDGEGAFISIRIATSEDFTALKPLFELFCDSRVSWQKPLDGTSEFPRMPPG